MNDEIIVSIHNSIGWCVNEEIELLIKDNIKDKKDVNIDWNTGSIVKPCVGSSIENKTAECINSINN